MHFSTTLTLVALSATARAAYSLVEHHQGSNFFDGWDFFTGQDPSHGYVNYLDRTTAQNKGLISTTSSQAYMGVDHTSVLDPNGQGRASVRITSHAAYNAGTLFIADFQKMPGQPGGGQNTPGGICGTWPAFWLVGPNWPNSGEVDIIEGINSNQDNTFVVHTNQGCVMNNQNSSVMRGQFDSNFGSSKDCSNGGCGGHYGYQWSYGQQHNAVAGGVWATELTASAIKVWFWPRIWIPSDIKAGNPNPASWTDKPFAVWSGPGCNIPAHFNNMHMVLNTNFCGDWAGNFWGFDSTCAAKASSCNAYVAANPAAFEQASWQVNYVSVFQ